MQLLIANRHQKRVRALGIALVACGLSPMLLAQQNIHRLSTGERKQILDGEFEVISTTKRIPSNIKQEFSHISRQPSFAMAEPGQKYQVGDVVAHRGLPFRRLIFAGVLNNRWFIHYERGGRGHSYYVVLFNIDPDGDAHFEWGGSAANSAKNLEQLRKMIADGQISDARNYYW